MTEEEHGRQEAQVGGEDDVDRYHVVYLTGAPAAGKSTLSRGLRERVQPLEVFEYGERLTAYLAERGASDLTQERLRARSSGVATAEDIVAVDNLLLDFVSRRRQRAHVVIDTHAVTKEVYGFRITPYSLQRISRLRPTMIVMLYTAPEIAIARIGAAPGGRPQVTKWEATFHAELQASVGVSYATQLGVPVYLLDSDCDPSELVGAVERRLARRPVWNSVEGRLAVPTAEPSRGAGR